MKTIKLLALATAFCLFGKNTFASIAPASNTCTPQVNIIPIPNTYGCYSITANNGIPNDPDTYYQWNFEDGTTGIGKTIYHCFFLAITPASYTLSLTYSSPTLCGPLSNVSVYTINLNPPSSNFCVNITPSITLVANTVTVWPIVAIPEIIFSYNYGDNSPSTPNYTYTYSNCGNYIVEVSQLDMFTQNTCYSYGAVNNNCDGISTGINKNDKEIELTLYPNPSKEILNIKTFVPITNIEVFDLLGKEIVLLTNIQNAQSKLYIESLSAGAYFVKIQLENKQKVYKKFIKE